MSALSRLAPFILLLCLSSPALAEPVKSLAHRDRLYDTAVLSSELFVVGHPGLLLHSKDKGKSFERIALPTREALFSIAFNSAGVGAIVGRGGLVLVSTDKGRTWTKFEAKTEADAAPAPAEGDGEGGPTGPAELPHLFAVDVLPDGTIVAVGEFGAILRSADRGKTWTRQPYSSKRPDVVATTAGSEGSGEKHRLSIEEENEGAIDEARLTSVRFADAQRGFIVGEFGLVLISEDGGKSWARQNSAAETLLFDVTAVGRDHAVAVGSEGTIVETLDGGSNWKVVDARTHEHLYGVSATADRLIVTGASGTVLRRAAGQQEVQVVRTDVHTWLVSIGFADATNGIIVGGRGYLLRTDDSGAHYKNVFGE